MKTKPLAPPLTAGLLLAILPALLAFTPIPARADTRQAVLVGLGNGTACYSHYYNTFAIYAGIITMDLDGVLYDGYCIDMYQEIGFGDALLVNGPLPDLRDDVDWCAVNDILQNYPGFDDVEAAAIQAALWYLVTAPYGPYTGSGEKYQFMSDPVTPEPYDGLSLAYGTAIRDRAFEILASVPRAPSGACQSRFPAALDLRPDQVEVKDCSNQEVVFTATVFDQEGDPLPGVTVHFATGNGCAAVEQDSDSDDSDSSDSDSSDSKSSDSGSKDSDSSDSKSSDSGSKDSDSSDSKSSDSGSKDSDSSGYKSSDSGSKDSDSGDSKSADSVSKDSVSRDSKSSDSHDSLSKDSDSSDSDDSKSSDSDDPDVTDCCATFDGVLSEASAVTDARGQVQFVYTPCSPEAVHLVNAWAEGEYGTLLYDAAGQLQSITTTTLVPFSIEDVSIIACRDRLVPEGASGCSLGFWKNHPAAWTGYLPEDLLADVFGIPPFLKLPPNDTLYDALRYHGGKGVEKAARALLKQAVAALLNAAHPDVAFAFTEADVIGSVTDALAVGDPVLLHDLAEQLEEENKHGCGK